MSRFLGHSRRAVIHAFGVSVSEREAAPWSARGQEPPVPVATQISMKRTFGIAQFRRAAVNSARALTHVAIEAAKGLPRPPGSCRRRV